MLPVGVPIHDTKVRVVLWHCCSFGGVCKNNFLNQSTSHLNVSQVRFQGTQSGKVSVISKIVGQSHIFGI